MVNVKSGLSLFVLVLSLVDGYHVPVYDEDGARGTEEPFLSADLAPTLEENIEPQESPASIVTFNSRFKAFSNRARDYVEDLRREHMRLRSDILDFMRELAIYMEKLPKNEIRVREIKFRRTCDCDERRRSPCPERCINSCYRDNHHYNNCANHIQTSTCYCYQGSSERCDYGMDDCYNENKIEAETYSPPCIEYGLNQTIFNKSFKLFAHLLIEPLKKIYRDINFKLNTMEDNLAASVILTDTTGQLCDGRNETSCFPMANDLLTDQLKRYSEAQRNITLHLINSQNVTRDTNDNIHDFKERTLTQINSAIKNYTCCLRALDFDVPNNNCDHQTPQPVIHPLPIIPHQKIPIPRSSNSLSLPDIAHSSDW